MCIHYSWFIVPCVCVSMQLWLVSKLQGVCGGFVCKYVTVSELMCKVQSVKRLAVEKCDSRLGSGIGESNKTIKNRTAKKELTHTQIQAQVHTYACMHTARYIQYL